MTDKMHPFRRPVLLLIAALLLPAWNGKARAEQLFERLSALRLLQMQSNLWSREDINGLTLKGSIEGHYTTNGALERGGTSDWYLARMALS